MHASVETLIPGASGAAGSRSRGATGPAAIDTYVALGTDPARLKRQMGHATAHMTMDVYADAMDCAEAASESPTTASAGSPEPAL